MNVIVVKEMIKLARTIKNLEVCKQKTHNSVETKLILALVNITLSPRAEIMKKNSLSGFKITK